ncbi:unannotated protein [freshwater metagenome]|uniref:Unannotated protein n=1 Tax=freshwater metagenome TaxID=449393 RepID=A0A6J7IHI5_9ZZZZ
MSWSLKALGAGLVLAAVGVAGCSSTTAGSSGAVQDDVAVLAPSASVPSSVPSSVPTSVPSAGASAGSAEPVAPAVPSSDESSNPASEGPLLGQSATSGVVCDKGLQYACGDKGPGGGVIYYAGYSAFACGATRTSWCQFLEVAPNGWNGTPIKCPNNSTMSTGTGCLGSPDQTSDWGSEGLGDGRGTAYCNGMGEKNTIPNASGTAIGTGYSNTTAMVENCKSDDAGSLARNYRGGGQTDWSVPSLLELRALANSPIATSIGGIAYQSHYWTSSQMDGSDSKKDARYFVMNSDSDGKYTAKKLTNGVRPVRAF